MKIGFITSSVDPDLIDDDRLVIPYLNEKHIIVEPVVWDKIDVKDLSGFDGLIFRSCWNYHRKYSQFLSWLKKIESFEGRIFNPIDTIRWNLNKKHIIELGRKVLVPKTRWLESGNVFSLQDFHKILNEWQASQLIIKPAISLGGHDTFLVSEKNIEQNINEISTLLNERDLLVQEFIPEIKTSGELSLVYFNREFSHAVRKVPAKNEFRVHSEYGGSRFAVDATPLSLKYSEKILEQVAGNLLYARVDIVETLRGPQLIELEVTDPMLYLHTHKQAANNFAEAITELVLT